MLTGLVCGLLPAFATPSAREADRLRERTATSPRMRGSLVIAEIAMAMVLLVGGGSADSQLRQSVTQDLGYDSSRAADLPGHADVSHRARAAQAFADQLVERIEALPGVTAAGYANNLPLVQQGFGRDVSPQPYDRGRSLRPPFPGLHAVSPDLDSGAGHAHRRRTLVQRGRAGGGEALVTRAFARSGFFDGPAIGRRDLRAASTRGTVVGILEDISQFRLDQRAGSEFYIVDFVPAPPGLGGTYFAVRTDADPRRDRRIACAASFAQLDAAATVDNIATMDQIVSNAMSRPRLYAVLLGIFAGVAMALAAIGIYGVLAYLVAHRAARDRYSHGARCAAVQVVALVLRQTAVLTVVGVVVGVIGRRGAEPLSRGAAVWVDAARPRRHSSPSS